MNLLNPSTSGDVNTPRPRLEIPSPFCYHLLAPRLSAPACRKVQKVQKSRLSSQYVHSRPYHRRKCPPQHWAFPPTLAPLPEGATSSYSFNSPATAEILRLMALITPRMHSLPPNYLTLLPHQFEPLRRRFDLMSSELITPILSWKQKSNSTGSWDGLLTSGPTA